MPSYDYECQECGHGFEEFQSMSADPLTTCPSCGENGLKRLIGGGLGIIFKGSGFYVNDSKKSTGSSPSSKSKESVTSSSGDTAGTSTSSEGTAKTETKKSDPVGSST